MFNYNYLVIFCVYVAAAISWVVDDEGCPINKNEYGNCVPIDDCIDLLLYLDQMSADDEQKSNILSNYNCGSLTFSNGTSVRKVCCPDDDNHFVFKNKKRHVRIKDMFDDKINRLPDICGISGKVNELHEYPWMAFLRYKNLIKCSGTIISDRYILTAAHCVADKNNLPDEVVLGDHNTETDTDCSSDDEKCSKLTKIYTIEERIVHENYSATDMWNDIALIRLSEEINFSSSASPICLPINKYFAKINNNSMIVCGWGQAGTEASNKQLMKANFKLVSNDDCQEEYSKISNVKIVDKQICAKGINSTFTCSGDSGGPLKSVKRYNRKRIFVQHGIISFRTVFCANDKPVVLTRISKYINWILDNITI